MHLIDAARGVKRKTTVREVDAYRKRMKIARGGTVSDVVALLKTKGIAKSSRFFGYPEPPAKGKFRKLKKLELQGDPEGWVMSRVTPGTPAYFAVSFRNIHSGFILVDSAKDVLWLDQLVGRGGKKVTGHLNTFLSRYLDGYVVKNRKYHAYYHGSTITELQF
jgi:hypothetical protein